MMAKGDDIKNTGKKLGLLKAAMQGHSAALGGDPFDV